MPQASAASVPMRIGRCQSARAAVWLRRGSITTSFTPVLRTVSSNAQKWTFTAIRSQPQAITRSECTTASGSVPPTGPQVMSQAVSQQVSQTVPA